jgi:hypothetical protein
MWSARCIRPLASRAVLVAAVLAVMSLVMAPAALAHSSSLPDARYYRSSVTSVSPAVAGLTLKLSQAGETVTLTNHTASTVEVLGYSGEDYLRITPTGVDENLNSLSAFLNGTLVIQGLPQQLGSQQQPPSWKHVSDKPTYTWHDHRMHWMAQQRPPVVAANPRVAHKVFDWTIQLRVADRPVLVSGVLTWVGQPGTGALGYALYGFGGVLAVAMIFLVIRERRARRPQPGDLMPERQRASSWTA